MVVVNFIKDVLSSYLGSKSKDCADGATFLFTNYPKGTTGYTCGELARELSKLFNELAMAVK